MELFQNLSDGFRKQKNYFLLIVISFLFFGLMLSVEISNGKFDSNDFRVMYTAAQQFWNGGQVYNIPFGLDTGYYKYSPVVLLLFTPSLLFSFSTASIIHFLLTYFSLIVLFQKLWEYFNSSYGYKVVKPDVVLILLLASIVGHLIREFHIGNINVLLLLMATISLIEAKNKNFIFSGLLFAIVVLTKPYLLILALPILLFKYYSVFWSSLFWTIALILISIFLFGPKHAGELYTSWFESMIAHSEYLLSNNTILHILETIIGKKISAQLGIPLFLSFSLLFFYFLKKKTKNKKSNHTHYLFLYGFSLLAFFPNFLVTDTEHFLFSLPMLFFLVIYLYEKKNSLLWLIYVVLVIFYLGESKLILGNEIGREIKLFGGIGIANLILVSWSLKLNLNRLDEQADN